jgi:3-oxoadipate enol-lactonase
MLDMPTIDADGCPINVEVEGRDDAPVLMLSNSLGTNLHMWDPQMPEFTKHFRVVRYDRRGHGKSGVPAPPYTMEQLGRDVLAIMDGLGIQKANWCGLSLGGLVGHWLGANPSDRFEKMVFCNTSSFYADKDTWTQRIAAVRKDGIAAVAKTVPARWFTAGFIAREAAQVARDEADGRGRDDPQGGRVRQQVAREAEERAPHRALLDHGPLGVERGLDIGDRHVRHATEECEVHGRGLGRV